MYSSCRGLLNFLHVAADFCEFITDHITEQVVSGNSVDVFRRYLIGMLAGLPAVMNYGCLTFVHSFQTNTGIVPLCGLFPST